MVGLIWLLTTVDSLGSLADLIILLGKLREYYFTSICNNRLG